MSDRTCPLGDDCDLTVAWMAGQQEARDSFRARINQLEVQLGLARTDADAQRTRAEAAEAENARLREALTPSGDTKADYIGEIIDPDTRKAVSWTGIKMVMAMISARADLAAIKEGGEG